MDKKEDKTKIKIEKMRFELSDSAKCKLFAKKLVEYLSQEDKNKGKL